MTTTADYQTIMPLVGRGPELPERVCNCRELAEAQVDYLDRPAITSPDKAAAELVPMIGGRDREHCAVITVDTKHRVLTTEIVSVGSNDHTFMSPREVYRIALLRGASAIVLGHNHPSGEPEPSRDDELVTRRLMSAGETIGVDLLDHLVIGGDRWVSLARRGVI